ncbi:MAG: Gfo/Idh/MocA family oxidoreductase [Myxococcales bacterium]|nr:Gfo/Idh/MocA family oxidoreductase [Myxococcales bacterium]
MTLRVALVGCGHMGTRHAAVIARDPSCELAVAVDVVPERARRMADTFGGRVADRVPSQVDAVVIATPTTTHADVAEPLLSRGQWCLVEKPLAHSVEAAGALANERCRVGHIERFNPAVRAAGQLRPHMVQGRREAPRTGRSEDVDVVFDLMIHDLDLVLGWMRSDASVSWLDASGVAVRGTQVDTASVRFRSTCGLTASLLASRTAERRRRVVRCYEPGRSTELDLLGGRAFLDGQECRAPDERDALTAQWDAFTAAIGGATEHGVPAAQGLRAVRLAVDVQLAMREATR